jgi:hypothetical protein
MSIVTDFIARLMPGSTLEVAQRDLSEAESDLARARAGFADDASSSRWRAVTDAEERVNQARVLLDAARAREAAAKAKVAAEERAELQRRRDELAKTLSYKALVAAHKVDSDRIIAAVLEIGDAIHAMEERQRDDRDRRRQLFELEEQLGIQRSAVDTERPFEVALCVREDIRDRARERPWSRYVHDIVYSVRTVFH